MLELKHRPKYARETGIRAVPPEETLARVLPLLGAAGLGEPEDITSKDEIGIPVFSVDRMETAMGVPKYYNGKGVTREQAEASAVMESIERYSAEPREDDEVVFGTYEQACDVMATIPPADMILPIWALDHLQGAEIAWTEGWDILRGERVWVPACAVFYPYIPDTDLQLFKYHTNGLASGNNMEEAVLHAIFELVERDAWSIAEYRNLPVPDVIPRTQGGRRETPPQKGAFRGVGEGLQAGEVLKGQGDAHRLKSGQEDIKREGERVHPSSGRGFPKLALMGHQRGIGPPKGTECLRKARPIGATPKEHPGFAQRHTPTMADNGRGAEAHRTVERTEHGAEGGLALGPFGGGEAEDLRPELGHFQRHGAERMEAGGRKPFRRERTLPFGQFCVACEVAQFHPFEPKRTHGGGHGGGRHATACEIRGGECKCHAQSVAKPFEALGALLRCVAGGWCFRPCAICRGVTEIFRERGPSVLS